MKKTGQMVSNPAFGDDKDRGGDPTGTMGFPICRGLSLAHQNKVQQASDQVINLWELQSHRDAPPQVKRRPWKRLELETPMRLEGYDHQMVALCRNGRLVKMSKRTGRRDPQ